MNRLLEFFRDKTRDDFCASLQQIGIDAELATRWRMRRRNGEYPFIKFTRRLLNALWKAGGKGRINRETIYTFSESKNPNQQLHYKNLLANHRLIHGDWENFIKRNQCSSLYRLRKPPPTCWSPWGTFTRYSGSSTKNSVR